MTSGELLGRLVAIFQGFEAHWAEENPYVREDGGFSLHAVWMDFSGFVAADQCSSRQLEALGGLVDECMAAPGDSENAVSTAFLEHLRQIRLEKRLRPYLGTAARQRMRA